MWRLCWRLAMVSLWCSMWIIATAALLVSAADAQHEPPGAPRCHHRDCHFIGHNETSSGNSITRKFNSYKIEGNEITIENYEQNVVKYAKTEKIRFLEIYCNGANVLGSPALPRAEHAFDMIGVRLWNCPLPGTGSLARALATLNVTVCKQDPQYKPCRLELEYTPTTPPNAPPLAAKHLVGLEDIQKMNIYRYNSIESDFLTVLKSLRNIHIKQAKLPAGTLDVISPTLEYILLTNTGTQRLPEAIHSSANLQTMLIKEKNPLDVVRVPPGLKEMNIKTPATTLRLDAAPALEKLWLSNWVEPLPPLVTRCERLRDVHFVKPTMRALPDGWLASCSDLLVLEIAYAPNLITLPPTMLPPFNSPLSELNLKGNSLEWLPENLLDNSLNLKKFRLYEHHRLKALPRNFFNKIGYQFTKVELSYNDLDSTVFETLGQLMILSSAWPAKLVDLDLSGNPRIGDVCDANGYSQLRNRKDIQELRLTRTSVTRICRDWREMPKLKLLDLRDTKISELSYEDLQYPRTVQADIQLWGAPVSAVRVTREDYNRAVRANPSTTTVGLSVELNCDCHMYWTRRALGHPLAQHTVPGIRELRCFGGALLRDVNPDMLVCSAQKECAVVALSEGFECTAQPDDVTDQDRWLVRVRFTSPAHVVVPRRLYPVYPIYHSNDQGSYLKQSISM